MVDDWWHAHCDVRDLHRSLAKQSLVELQW